MLKQIAISTGMVQTYRTRSPDDNRIKLKISNRKIPGEEAHLGICEIKKYSSK